MHAVLNAKSFRLFVMIAVLGLLASACSGPEDEGAEDDQPVAEEATPDGEAAPADGSEAEGEEEEAPEVDLADRRVLRVGGFAADIGLLDPQFANAGMDRQIMKPMFEGLVRYIPGDITAGFEPAIATEVPEVPEPNEDGTQTWEFDIREGVMCHPGPNNDQYELTAEDVVLSYEKTMNPETAAFAPDYEVVESVEAVDDRTVAFTLSSPRSASLFLPLVADFAGGYVVCSQAVNMDNVEEFQSHPVGTGPFMFSEYNPGNNIVLEANDDYWRGPPRLAGIDMSFMADESSRTLALQAGELDFIFGVLEDQWVERIDAEDGLTAIALPVGGLHFLNINMAREPFDDLRVRQAVAYAQNRAAHVAVSGETVKVPAYSVEPLPDSPGGLSFEEAQELGLDYSHDPERARELLAEAGYPDGFSFEVVSSELAIYSDHYVILQAALADVGIDMQVEVVDHPTMHQLIREDNNALVEYLAPRPTMDQLLTQFAHSDSIVVEGESPVSNFSHFTGADDLIEEARVETDEEKQAELWREANIKILEEAAIIANTHDNNTFAWQDDFDPGHEPIATLESSFVLNENTGFTN